MQKETQQFSQMGTEENLMVRTTRQLECFAIKQNPHWMIVLFPNTNITFMVGYGVQAGPNNGQQVKGTILRGSNGAWAHGLLHYPG